MNASCSQRYARHFALPEIGEAGQARLAAARVLVVGAGGLGSPAALYLAAAGVGGIGLMDGDYVEESNLQRQVLYTADDVGRPKVDVAAGRLRALNPAVHVIPLAERMTGENAAERLAGYEFVIDATDSFESKFVVADACLAAGRPYSHAGVSRFLGQTLTVMPGRTACCRCLFDPPPPAPPGPPAGPLGAVPGAVGAIQAAEAVKHLLGIGRLLTDRLLVFDALGMTARVLTVRRRPDCRCAPGAGGLR
jgi:molybdopterin-synthase adenylyltransferase